MEINKIYQGNSLVVLKTFSDNSIDSIVTDPPYELGFMGKSWDNTGIAQNVELWKEAFRVLKPGGHLLSFGGSRTYHRMACAIEDAGFEIRDMIEWIYGSGFPKSLNISKMIDKKPETLMTKKFKEWIGEQIDKCEKTSKQINGECGFTATSYRKTDDKDYWSSNFPTQEKWAKMKEVIGFSDEYDFVIRDNKNERGFIEPTGNIHNGSGNNIQFSGKQLADNPIENTARQWDGWGTALKPSHESICVAQKSFQHCADFDNLFVFLLKNLKIELCKKLSVQTAEKNLKLNQVDQKEVVNIAQWSVKEPIDIREDLSVLMGMLQLELEINMSWNIVLSWLNILEDLYTLKNIYTTSTELNMITELKILNSLEWENIFQNITQAKDDKTDGLNANVYTVELLLKGVQLKLTDIQTRFAQENVILKAKEINFAPNSEPICMARKPLSEKTVVLNVLKWGTGGINIDECRINTTEQDKYDLEQRPISKGKPNENIVVLNNSDIDLKHRVQNLGRFPANIIFDEEAGRLLDEQAPSQGAYAPVKAGQKGFGGEIYGKYKQAGDDGETFYNDGLGGASRFFYTAKTSQFERNIGCKNEAKIVKIDGRNITGNPLIDSLHEYNKSPKRNNHPTVKPIALMEYLVKLVTKEGMTVLDMFGGSGSTGIACVNTLRNYILIEKEQEYVDIAEDRIERFKKVLSIQNKLF